MIQWVLFSGLAVAGVLYAIIRYIGREEGYGPYPGPYGDSDYSYETLDSWDHSDRYRS